jgi:nucleoside-triphosphatase
MNKKKRMAALKHRRRRKKLKEKEKNSDFNKRIMEKILLLTGKPGTGKTAIIKEAIAKAKIKVGGFYTQEIRAGGVRQGFEIVTLDGKEAILAHINISSPYQVSKYKVDIDSLNEVGVSALHQALDECDLIITDEIGKMELLSPQFRETVLQAIDSGKKVLGTIMLSPHPFADEIKSHQEVKTLLVTRANHNEVLREVLNWLKEEVT